jgi:hypothetical protein
VSCTAPLLSRRPLVTLTLAVQWGLARYMSDEKRAEMNRLAREGKEEAARAILQDAYNRYVASQRRPRYLDR